MQERAVDRPLHDSRWIVPIATAFVLAWASGFVVPGVFMPYAQPFKLLPGLSRNLDRERPSLACGILALFGATHFGVAYIAFAEVCAQWLARRCCKPSRAALNAIKDHLAALRCCAAIALKS